MLKIKLNNGKILPVKDEDAPKVMRLFEDAGLNPKLVDVPMYWSKSHGQYLEIPGMNTQHIINAMRAIYRDWVEGLVTHGMSASEFVSKLVAGPTDPVFNNLFVELAKRAKEEK